MVREKEEWKSSEEWRLEKVCPQLGSLHLCFSPLSAEVANRHHDREVITAPCTFTSTHPCDPTPFGTETWLTCLCLGYWRCWLCVCQLPFALSSPGSITETHASNLTSTVVETRGLESVSGRVIGLSLLMNSSVNMPAMVKACRKLMGTVDKAPFSQE